MAATNWEAMSDAAVDAGLGPADAYDEEPAPTVEDHCAADGHRYEGDDGDRGRCYCGQRCYPLGGPVDPPSAPGEPF